MKSLVMACMLLFLSHVTSAQTFKKKYKGNVGPYPVTATLIANNGNLSGTYYYEKFTDPISIRGIVVGKNIEFKGYDLKGNKIDEFIGQYNKFDIIGIWIGENSNKRIPFNLTEEVVIPYSHVTSNAWVLVSIGLCLFIIFAIVKIYNRKVKQKKVLHWIETIDAKIKDTLSPHDKGYEFEKFLTNCLNDEEYKLLEWRADKYYKGRYPTNNKKPDLEFERKNILHSNKVFSIECKYHPKPDNNKIHLGKKCKVLDYKSYSRIYNKPVFIAIGLGGKPSNPDSLYIVPIDKLNNELINLNEISEFKVSGSKLFYDPDQLTLK
jgi:hypothetical protein